MDFNKQNVINIIRKELEVDLRVKKKICTELMTTIKNADSAMTTRSDTYIFQYRQQIDNLSKFIQGIEKLMVFLRAQELSFIKLDNESVYVVVPDFGLMKRFEVDGVNICVVSEKSPIGECLIDKKVDDEFEFRDKILKIKEVI